MKKSNRKTLKHLLSEDKSLEVINYLLRLTESKDSYYYNDLVIISAQYRELESLTRKGVTAITEAHTQKAKITNSVLNIIDNLSEEDLSEIVSEMTVEAKPILTKETNKEVSVNLNKESNNKGITFFNSIKKRTIIVGLSLITITLASLLIFRACLTGDNTKTIPASSPSVSESKAINKENAKADTQNVQINKISTNAENPVLQGNKVFEKPEKKSVPISVNKPTQKVEKTKQQSEQEGKQQELNRIANKLMGSWSMSATFEDCKGAIAHYTESNLVVHYKVKIIAQGNEIIGEGTKLGETINSKTTTYSKVIKLKIQGRVDDLSSQIILKTQEQNLNGVLLDGKFVINTNNIKKDEFFAFDRGDLCNYRYKFTRL